MTTEALPVDRAPTRAADFVALTKPRLNLLVIATAAAGYYLGARRSFDPVGFFHAVAGTALIAGGSAALNMAFERDADSRMTRTRVRPIPGGRIQVREAIVFAVLLTAAGTAQLLLGANLLAAALALTTLVIYALIYTPLKPRTAFSTVVGAIPGALPPMIGWAAATGTVSREAWVLFGIIFLWQLPHFLAIAWLFRDDYELAGFPLLPVVEREGLATAYQVATYTSTLLPVSLLPTLVGLAGARYFVGTFLLGAVFLWIALRFARARTRDHARVLFFASIIYLPLVFGLMIADAVR
jgi:protoheme IX farnesyltransferase